MRESHETRGPVVQTCRRARTLIVKLKMYRIITRPRKNYNEKREERGNKIRDATQKKQKRKGKSVTPSKSPPFWARPLEYRMLGTSPVDASAGLAWAYFAVVAFGVT